MTFTTFYLYKCRGTQIWHCRKKSKGNLWSSLNKLGRPSWVQHAIYQDLALTLAYFWRRKIFKSFTIYGLGRLTGQIHKGIKNLIRTKTFDYLITHCKFQPKIFITFEKMTFTTFYLYKCRGTQIWHCRKKSKGNLWSSLNKLGRPSWVQHAIYQDLALTLAYFWRRKIFKSFTIYGLGRLTGHVYLNRFSISL